MTQDLHTLAGAYALDALPHDELLQFEEHLATCESCAREVRGMAESAARIGGAAARTPPPAMRARVLAQAQTTPQLPPLADGTAAPPAPTPLAGRVPKRRRWLNSTRLLAGVAAACMVAVVATGIAAVRYQADLDQARALNQEISAVLAAPDAEVATGEATASGSGSAVTSRARDQAVVVTAGLGELDETQTFELWALEPDADPRSAGLMRPDDAGATPAVLVEDVADAEALAVTVEPAGGSPTGQPTSDPVLVIPVT